MNHISTVEHKLLIQNSQQMSIHLLLTDSIYNYITD